MDFGGVRRLTRFHDVDETGMSVGEELGRRLDEGQDAERNSC